MRLPSMHQALLVLACTLTAQASAHAPEDRGYGDSPEGAVYAANGKRLGPVSESERLLSSGSARVLTRIEGKLIYVWLQRDHSHNDRKMVVANTNALYFKERNCKGQAFLYDNWALGVWPSATLRTNDGRIFVFVARGRPATGYVSTESRQSGTLNYCENVFNRLDKPHPAGLAFPLSDVYPEPYELLGGV